MRNSVNVKNLWKMLMLKNYGLFAYANMTSSKIRDSSEPPIGQFFVCHKTVVASCIV